MTLETYPESAGERTRWIASRRGPKNRLDVSWPYAWLHEEERDAEGRLVPTNTLFLTNRECPYRCLMCDLWQNTLDETVATGAITRQIAYALERLPPAEQIKLYNAGSFFDDRAIPRADDAASAALLREHHCNRVIVESHPALIGARCLEFNAMLDCRLEVAIGLETAHPQVLDKLNKRFDLDDFRAAAGFLRNHDIDLRTFILLRPPFMTEEDGVEWALKSLELSFDCGAIVCCLIPTRAGNGAMEALQKAGHFSPPKITSLETALECGIALASNRGRVFADTWDLERFAVCTCDADRIERIKFMNKHQSIPGIKASGANGPCEVCGCL